jgi:sigma-E factor negative regulatory protein RseC
MAGADTKETIQHDGVVQQADGKSVFVKITSLHACSGCHAEGSCALTGKEEKIIEVLGNYSVKIGDLVTVMMTQSMGYTAVLLGYILPLIIVILTLIILISFSITELTAGLLSLSVLAPYYFLMYIFRNKIDKKFTFTIKA